MVPHYLPLVVNLEITKVVHSELPCDFLPERFDAALLNVSVTFYASHVARDQTNPTEEIIEFLLAVGVIRASRVVAFQSQTRLEVRDNEATARAFKVDVPLDVISAQPRFLGALNEEPLFFFRRAALSLLGGLSLHDQGQLVTEPRTGTELHQALAVEGLAALFAVDLIGARPVVPVNDHAEDGVRRVLGAQPVKMSAP